MPVRFSHRSFITDLRLALFGRWSWPSLRLMMRALLLLLLGPTLAWAGDFAGIVKYADGVPPERDLGKFGRLSLIHKEDQQLHWRIFWRSDEKVTRSITSGEGVGPGEECAYFWDEAARTLWYCTPRTVVKIAFVDDVSSETLYRPTKNYEKYSDLPPAFRAEIKKLAAVERPANG